MLRLFAKEARPQAGLRERFLGGRRAADAEHGFGDRSGAGRGYAPGAKGPGSEAAGAAIGRRSQFAAAQGSGGALGGGAVPNDGHEREHDQGEIVPGAAKAAQGGTAA